jgi:hypothetical protein
LPQRETKRPGANRAFFFGHQPEPRFARYRFMSMEIAALIAVALVFGVVTLLPFVSSKWDDAHWDQ